MIRRRVRYLIFAVKRHHLATPQIIGSPCDSHRAERERVVEPRGLTTATTNCPEAATKLPAGGHENCPLTVMGSCPFTGGPWCHVVAGVGSQGLPVRALWMASMARTLWPRVLTR